MISTFTSFQIMRPQVLNITRPPPYPHTINLLLIPPSNSSHHHNSNNSLVMELLLCLVVFRYNFFGYIADINIIVIRK
jgi:hypothetical protein